MLKDVINEYPDEIYMIKIFHVMCLRECCICMALPSTDTLIQLGFIRMAFHSLSTEFLNGGWLSTHSIMNF